MKADATSMYLNRHLHEQIDRDIQLYLKRGGKIQKFPQGASAIDLSQPKAMNRAQAEIQRQKKQNKLVARIFNNDEQE